MIRLALDILGGQAVQAARLLAHLRTEAALEVSFLPINPRLPGALRRLQAIKYVRTVVTSLLYCATLLARVQGCWSEAVGPAIAAEAQPLAERGGTLTVVCRSATWASELELLASDLVAKLNRALGGTAGNDLTALRTRVGKLP